MTTSTPPGLCEQLKKKLEARAGKPGLPLALTPLGYVRFASVCRTARAENRTSRDC